MNLLAEVALRLRLLRWLPSLLTFLGALLARFRFLCSWLLCACLHIRLVVIMLTIKRRTIRLAIAIFRRHSATDVGLLGSATHSTLISTRNLLIICSRLRLRLTSLLLLGCLVICCGRLLGISLRQLLLFNLSAGLALILTICLVTLISRSILDVLIVGLVPYIGSLLLSRLRLLLGVDHLGFTLLLVKPFLFLIPLASLGLSTHIVNHFESVQFLFLVSYDAQVVLFLGNELIVNEVSQQEFSQLLKFVDHLLRVMEFRWVDLQSFECLLNLKLHWLRDWKLCLEPVR